jgi:hypothetical protein
MFRKLIEYFKPRIFVEVSQEAINKLETDMKAAIEIFELAGKARLEEVLATKSEDNIKQFISGLPFVPEDVLKRAMLGGPKPPHCLMRDEHNNVYRKYNNEITKVTISSAKYETISMEQYMQNIPISKREEHSEIDGSMYKDEDNKIWVYHKGEWKEVERDKQ